MAYNIHYNSYNMYRTRFFFLLLGVAATRATVVALPENSVTFTYTLWFDKNDDCKPSLELSVPADTTMFQAMQKAAEIDSAYGFESKFFKGLGNYITSIGGRNEVPSEKKYWILYKLPFLPTSNGNPEADYKPYESQCGVDCTFPAKGEYILFWLRAY